MAKRKKTSAKTAQRKAALLAYLAEHGPSSAKAIKSATGLFPGVSFYEATKSLRSEGKLVKVGHRANTCWHITKKGSTTKQAVHQATVIAYLEANGPSGGAAIRDSSPTLNAIAFSRAVKALKQAGKLVKHGERTAIKWHLTAGTEDPAPVVREDTDGLTIENDQPGELPEEPPKPGELPEEPPTLGSAITARLRDIRRAEKLGQDCVAEALDMSVSEISRLERSVRGVRADLLEPWAHSLGYELQVVVWKADPHAKAPLDAAKLVVLSEVAAALSHLPPTACRALIEQMRVWKKAGQHTDRPTDEAPAIIPPLETGER